jgi:DNA (cytosine-5)-methyltransferase 1
MAKKIDKNSIANKAYSPSFVDIFAGCGGLSVGLMAAGWEGVFAVERDSNAFETLCANLVEKKNGKRFQWPSWLPKKAHSVDEILDSYKDKLGDLAGEVDMLVGGPPCQGFSSAGRRDPNDPRNKLTEAYLKFVGLIKPKIVLIENVRGITVDFDHDEGVDGKVNYARLIIDKLEGEYNVFTRLIDTSTFGVPQKRIRFFIVGLRREVFGESCVSPFELLEDGREEFLNKKDITVPVGARDAISDLEIKKNGRRESLESPGFEEISYVGPITAYQKYLNGLVGSKITDTRLARHKPHIEARFSEIIEICHQQGRLNVSLSAELKASYGLRKCAIRVLDPNSPSPTVTSMPDDLIHYNEPRTLTVRENARLQSFPDSFVFKGKYTTGGDRRKKEVPRFTQVANAVPPLMAEAIGQSLREYLLKYSAPLAIDFYENEGDYSESLKAA